MTPDEFKKQLEQLREVIHRALGYYAVWKALKLHDKDSAGWSLEDQNGVLGRFRGFFTPAAFALLDMALIEFAKLFDTDSRTASLGRLLAAARRDRGLVPHTSPADLREISGRVRHSKTLLNTLKHLRDQRLAHIDANPTPVDPLLTKDMDKLAESVVSAFNALSVGHDQNYFSFDFPLRESERHTAEILGILLDDRDRKRQDFDDTMVGIGLGELRRVEETMGQRVNKNEIRPYIQTFGLTSEQMERVEREYIAGTVDGSPE